MYQRFIQFSTKSPLRVTLVISLISILYSFPQFEKLAKPSDDIFLRILQKQIQHPLTPITETQIISYGPNRAFRLTPPLIGQLFRYQSINNQAIGIWIFGVLSGLTFFYILYSYLLSRFGSKEKAFYFALGTSFLFLGNSFYFDMEWFISFAYFFLMAAMLSKNKILAIVCLLLAFFTDERAFIASFSVLFFWVYADNRKLIPSIVTYALAAITYLSLYFILKKVFHLGYAPTNDFFVRLFDQFKVIPLTVSMSIKSYWYYFIFLFLPIKREFPLLHKLIVVAAILTLVFFSLSIADTTKSLSFLYFYAFTFYCIAENQISLRDVRAVALVALFVPSYVFIGWEYGYASPIGYQQATKVVKKVITAIVN